MNFFSVTFEGFFDHIFDHIFDRKVKRLFDRGPAKPEFLTLRLSGVKEAKNCSRHFTREWQGPRAVAPAPTTLDFRPSVEAENESNFLILI